MTKRYNILTRCLAAVALLFVYVASTSAILVGATYWFVYLRRREPAK